MKILFDAVELTPVSKKSRGIYNYAMSLCQALAQRLGPQDTLVVPCNGENIHDLRALGLPPSVTLVEMSPAMPGHLFRQAWMRWRVHGFAASHAADVYLSPKGFVPAPLLFWRRKALPAVCVLHDLIPFWYFTRRPGYFGFLETLLVKAALRNTMDHADHVIAISEATRRAVLDQGVPGSRLSVVHNGLPPAASGLVEEKPSGVPDGYVFGMASNLPHKNLDGLLKAYRAYRVQAGAAALPLLLCGASDITDEGVRALGAVSNEALIGLYRHASAFLFLPFIEGFGFPPLEALRVGTPVVCARIPALEETCGALATYVDPEDPDGCASALMATLAGRAGHDRQALARASLQRIEAMFSWTACADGVLKVARMVLKDQHALR